MRFAVVATAVVASVLLLLWCPGVVVTGDATDDTRARVCSSSSLQYCSMQRPPPSHHCRCHLHQVTACQAQALALAVTVRGSLVCSPLGMITLVYHKEYSKCLKLSKFQKRSVAKKIHESLTTARTLDIYNPDSSIHCYFRLLASQPAREDKVMCGWSVGARQKLLFFFP